MYFALGRTGYRRNLAYAWSHMINNLASAIFGFIYVALWQAIAPTVASPGDPYSRSTMTHLIVLAQVFAWVTIFLPAGLGIHTSVRSGNIAMEMARPAPFFQMTLAREVGSVIYQFAFRSLPLMLLFALTIGFPRPSSPLHLLMTIPSLLLGSYTALMLFYTIGLSALWTTEIRSAHWTYMTLVSLLSGAWIPADILPGWLGKVAPYLPFASQAFYPVRIYLGLAGGSGMIIQLFWAVVMTLWCQWLTGRALHRVNIQGG